MSFTNALHHLLNFILPALLVGGLLAATAPLALRLKAKRTIRQAMLQGLVNTLTGIAALALGLYFYAADGKMMTYVILVTFCSLSQIFQSNTD